MFFFLSWALNQIKQAMNQFGRELHTRDMIDYSRLRFFGEKLGIFSVHLKKIVSGLTLQLLIFSGIIIVFF